MRKRWTGTPAGNGTIHRWWFTHQPGGAPSPIEQIPGLRVIEGVELQVETDEDIHSLAAMVSLDGDRATLPFPFRRV